MAPTIGKLGEAVAVVTGTGAGVARAVADCPGLYRVLDAVGGSGRMRKSELVKLSGCDELDVKGTVAFTARRRYVACVETAGTVQR